MVLFMIIEACNPAIPAAARLFLPVHDRHGSRLALEFGNENAGGKCPFYTQKQCHHCDIGAGEGVQFTHAMNVDRLFFFRKHYADTLLFLEHLVIYNSGSTLNQREFSRETLGHILTYAASLPSVALVSLDTRKMYVTEDSIDYVVGKLRPNQQVRVNLGLESQTDAIRIGKLNKSMTKKGIERAFALVGKYRVKVGIDINVLFQPPELVGEAAIQDAVATVEYGLGLAKKYGPRVDFNFHPNYPSKRSLDIYPHHPRADLAVGVMALKRMKEAIMASKQMSYIFIGWQDQGHDQEPEKRADLEQRLTEFEDFNQSQLIEFLNFMRC